jgi:hypothetical protein
MKIKTNKAIKKPTNDPIKAKRKNGTIKVCSVMLEVVLIVVVAKE